MLKTLDYEVEYLCMMLDNTAHVLASTLELTRRVQPPHLLGRMLRKWLRYGQLKTLFGPGEELQFSEMEKCRKAIEEAPEYERSLAYDAIARHYQTKVEEGNDMSHYLNVKFHERFPFPV